MSEIPPVKGASFFQKKVVGIPVVYFAAGAVLILAVFAWQTKSTSVSVVDTQPESSGDTILSEDDLPPLPLGTVYPMPSSPADTTDGTGIDDNDEWLKKGVMYLSTTRGVSPGDAQQALSLYLDGADLSWQQGEMRDNVIREIGMPPYPVSIGSTAPDIGRTQGALPRDHSVKGVNDNTATKLAGLYYGRSDAFAVKAITDANGGAANFAVGASVKVPALPTPATVTPAPVTSTPKPAPAPVKPVVRYHVVVRGDSLSRISVKYYRTSSKWRIIYDANRRIIGSNPNLIKPGQRLRIP